MKYLEKIERTLEKIGKGMEKYYRTTLTVLTISNL